MFNFEAFARVATAAVGALVLSTLSVAAAVGPAETATAATPSTGWIGAATFKAPAGA